jgi:hypothetical protein
MSFQDMAIKGEALEMKAGTLLLGPLSHHLNSQTPLWLVSHGLSRVTCYEGKCDKGESRAEEANVLNQL